MGINYNSAMQMTPRAVCFALIKDRFFGPQIRSLLRQCRLSERECVRIATAARSELRNLTRT